MSKKYLKLADVYDYYFVSQQKLTPHEAKEGCKRGLMYRTYGSTKTIGELDRIVSCGGFYKNYVVRLTDKGFELLNNYKLQK